MQTKQEKTQDAPSRQTPAPAGGRAAQRFEDRRPETTALQRLQDLSRHSPQQQNLQSLQAKAAQSPQTSRLTQMQSVMQQATASRFPLQRLEAEQPAQRVEAEEEELLQGKFEAVQRVEEEEPLQGKFEAVQRVEEEEPLQGKFEPVQRVEEEELLQGKFEAVQRVEEEKPLQGKFAPQAAVQRQEQTAVKPNNTGLPDNLKAGIESLSGMSMDKVKVHYNSSQPAALNALAYAQGTDIHMAPGQEKHLPHEAWHVVQQAQGRVRPTMQMKGGVAVNDDVGLEAEADVMGMKAAWAGESEEKYIESAANEQSRNAPVQGYWQINKERRETLWKEEPYRKQRPFYQPYGYKLVTQTGNGAGEWEDFDKPIEGKSVIHWPASDYKDPRVIERTDGIKLADYLEVGYTVVTKFGGKGKVEVLGGAVGHQMRTDETMKLSAPLSQDSTPHSAGKSTWAFIQPTPKLEAPEGFKGPALIKNISLGFQYLGVTMGQKGGARKISSSEGGRSFDALREFSEATGTVPWQDWGEHNPESPLNPKRGSLINKITETMGTSGSIHFNLDGFIKGESITKLLDQGRRNDGKTGFHTGDELYVILYTPALLDKTTFYLKGKALSIEETRRYIGEENWPKK